jgi:SAM-dependent methyltransferase
MVVITSSQRDVIFDAVRAMYTDVARSPQKEFHFPTGRAACVAVGYPAAELDRIPAAAVESFAGVGYPFAARVIREGDTVLDIGSGAGTDTLLASRLVGDSGRVIGLDLTAAMREKLRGITNAAGVRNVAVLDGNAEENPLPDESVDVVTSNGVLNLVPDKAAAFREMVRVLKPGGRVQIADIVVASEPSDACKSQPVLWAECIVGAVTEEAYLDLLRLAGLDAVEVLSHLDYFALSASAETRKVAGGFGAKTMVLRGRKP